MIEPVAKFGINGVTDDTMLYFYIMLEEMMFMTQSLDGVDVSVLETLTMRGN